MHCYVYRRDESVGRDASLVTKTADYDLPLRKDRKGCYKVRPEDGVVYTCMTSDFFLEDADEWRKECWSMIRLRRDLHFAIITKRITRFASCIPEDWGEGYPNVTVYCTAENQEMADLRLPVFLKQPILHRRVIHEPMLGPVNIEQYLSSGQIEGVICGGESGNDARPCHYEWILGTREQCLRHQTSFVFKQTGAVFVKDGKIFHIDRKLQHSQAQKAGIDYEGSIPWEEEAPSTEQGLQEQLSLLGPEAEQNREEWLRRDLFERLSASAFRMRFRLKPEQKAYVREKGIDVIRRHAENFIAKRLAPAVIPNDGKQTPMRGHPVFIAQHACACCCRGCLQKWHDIPPGRELTPDEQQYVVEILMRWIERQMNGKK